MKTKHQVHNLIILDESGSMQPISRSIIQGFNELVQTIRGIEKEYPDQEHFISLITFNGLGQKILHFTDPVSRLQLIDDSRYRPDSSTPLYDAMGYSLGKLRSVLENRSDYHVLVTILTDGEENASKEYKGPAIRSLVEELKQSGWTFTYIGTDHDVEKFATSIAITNTMTFMKDEAGMKDMFLKEKSARLNYSLRIRDNAVTDEDFYENNA